MDYTIDDVINIPFTTRAFATGVPTVLTGAQTVEIYEDASITPIVEGASKLVLTIDLNSIVGFNMATATLSAANGFEVGKHYTLIIKTGTVGGVSVVGEVVGEFTVGFHAATVDLANATDGLGALSTDIGTAQADLNTITGTAGVLIGTDAANVTEISDAVWDEATSAHAIAGSFGKSAADVLVDTADIQPNYATEAKQDTAQTDLNTITGTAGVLIGTDAANVTEISDAVWDEVLTGGNHNIATSAGRRLRALNDFGQYEGGAVWYDDVNGAAGATDFENGTVNNPCSAEADVVTLLASLGLTTVHCAPGSTYVMASTYNNNVFEGENWTLQLASQDVAGTVIIGAAVSGIATGVGTTQQFKGCIMGATSIIKGTHYINCGFSGTQTLTEAGDIFFDQCHSAVAGTGSVTFDFGAALNSSNLNVRHHSGGWTIANMGAGTGTYSASFEGDGQIVWAASCSATSNASIRGNWKITDNASGAVTETLDDNQVGVDQIGTAGAGLTNLGGSSNDWNTVVPDAAGVAPTAAEVVNEWETQSQADPTGFHVNVLEVSGTAEDLPTATALAVVDANVDTMVAGLVTGAFEGTPTTTVMQTNLAEATDDHYNGAVLIITSGNGLDQRTDITDYAGATGTLTVTAVATAPVATDTFKIV